MTKAVAVKFDIDKGCYSEEDIKILNEALKEGYKPIQNYQAPNGSVLMVLIKMNMGIMPKE